MSPISVFNKLPYMQQLIKCDKAPAEPWKTLALEWSWLWMTMQSRPEETSQMLLSL